MIADAPYIVDAEVNGLPEPPIIKCPCCGAECETYFMDRFGVEVLGCECCVKIRDAADVAE